MSELNVMAQWLQAHQDWLAVMIGFIAFLESLVVVGLVLPGVVMLFTAASLAGGGTLDVWAMLFAGFVGAVLGDGVSFIAGQVFHRRIKGWWPFTRHPQWLAAGERFFDRHGGVSIALGRFIGPIRPVIPVVAGMMGMPARYFYLVNILSALVWAPVYLLPGYFVGASLHWQKHMAVELLVLVVVSGFLAVCLAYGCQWAVMRACSFKRLLNQAMAVCFGLLVMFAVSALSPLGGELNQNIHHWMQALRTPLIDRFFYGFTVFGDVLIMSVMVMMGAFWLWRDSRSVLEKRYHSVVLFLVVAGALKLAINLLKLGFSIDRPDIATEVSFAFPSGHTAYTLFMGLWLGWYFCRNLPSRYKPWPWSLGIMMGLLMGLSRLYIGEHWLADVLGGAALGALFFVSWLMLLERFRINCPNAGTGVQLAQLAGVSAVLLIYTFV